MNPSSPQVILVGLVLSSAALFATVAASREPTWVQSSSDSVQCLNIVGSPTCPTTTPVCCYREDGSVSGCCPQTTVCTFEGRCETDVGPNTEQPQPHNVPLRPVSTSVPITLPMIIGVAALLIFMALVCFSSYHARDWWSRFKEWYVKWKEARRLRAEERERARREKEPDVDSDEEEALLAHYRTKDDAATAGIDDGTTTASSRCASVSVPPNGLCHVCHIQPVDCVVFPCGHFVTCHVCSRHLKRCRECKVLIVKRKKVFQA